MITAQHTPGPWRYFHAANHDEPCVAVTTSGDTHGPDLSIALCCYQAGLDDSPHTTEEQRLAAAMANARLIAAAPELLAALTAIMDGQIGGSPDLNAERFQLARAAIAKAKAKEDPIHPEWLVAQSVVAEIRKGRST